MASVANTYARAFADVVLETHLPADRAVGELKSIATLLTENPALRRVWENPAIPAQEKRGVLDGIVKVEGLSKPVRNLMAVLMDHRRVQFLESIITHLEKELDARLGFADAQITSAHALGESEKAVLEKQIASMTGKKVKASYQQNGSLLGGAVVRIGSTVYDGSVLGQLHRIKEAMLSETV